MNSSASASPATTDRPNHVTAFNTGLAQAAALVGALSAVAFTIVTLTSTITPDGRDFQRAGDYWYTGIGMIPAMASALVLVQALHAMQTPQDGRRGLVGAMLMSAGLAVHVVTGGLALIIGRASSFGPTYLLASAATIVGLVLFTAGSWHTGVLPPWMLCAWIVAWLVGGPFAQGPTPLLLAVVYVGIAILLRRRTHQLSTAAPGVHGS